MTADVRLLDGDHVVQFYDAEESLVGVVGSYLSAALAEGDSVVVIAAPGHRQAFRSALAGVGMDLDVAEREHRLTLMDAATTLARFTIDGRIDSTAFDREVGGVVRAASASGRPVRAYGEMVALLWEAGDVDGAIRLERLWNELGDRTPFSLFCAYPATSVTDPGVFGEISTLHSAVIDESWQGRTAEATRSFERTLRSPALARRFVSETLRSWRLEYLSDEAVLIVSELATNAVIHARSDFTVALTLLHDRVRISVSDRSPSPPRVRASGPEDPHGLGLHLVGAFARTWSHERVPLGKRVWADVGLVNPGSPGLAS